MTRRLIVAGLTVATLVSSCTFDDGSATSNSATTSPDVPATESIESAAPTTTEPVPDYDDVGSVPPGAAGESTGPLGSTELRIDTDAGTVQIGAGEVPERLGPLFPLPPDLEVELASETAVDLGFSGTTAAAFDELVELYRVGLPAAGFTIVSFDRRGSEFGVFEFADGDQGTGQVAITATPGTDGFTLIVTFAGSADDETQAGN
jgi:hypothetical protein